MLSCHSGGENTDADAGDADKGFAAGKKRGAGSENVVDK